MDTAAIKAIETRYAGCRFRSRLEARWAVFFDEVGVSWEYEPQGFHVGMSQTSYLPDFFLPDSRTWVEVKGELTRSGLTTIIQALDYGHGLPGTANGSGSERGILLLGPVPRVDERLPIHPLFVHHKGVIVEGAIFTAIGLQGGQPYWDGYFADGGQSEDVPNSLPWPCRYSRALGPFEGRNREVLAAYVAARSARFEHGESPTASKSFERGYLLAARLAARAVITDDQLESEPEAGTVQCLNCGSDGNIGSHGLCPACWTEDL